MAQVRSAAWPSAREPAGPAGRLTCASRSSASATSAWCSARSPSPCSATGWSPSRWRSRCSSSAGRRPRSGSCSPPHVAARRHAADRRRRRRPVSRRTVMVAADLARLPPRARSRLLLITGEPAIWALAVLSGLTGAATGFFNPASTGLLPAVVAPGAPAAGQRPAGHRDVGRGDRRAGARRRADRRRRPGLGAGDRRARRSASAPRSWPGLRLPPRVPREATSFLHDLRDGLGRVPLAHVGVERRPRRVAREPAVGRVERRSGRSSPSTISAAPRSGAPSSAAMGVGALVGALIAGSGCARAARCVLATVAFAMFAVPPALLAAGARRRCSPLGALLAGARDDARQSRLGVDAAAPRAAPSRSRG